MLGTICSVYCDPVEATASLGSSTGVVTPTACPEGYYCPENTTSKSSFPCPAGTFSNETHLERQSDCKTCMGGYFCESPGQKEPTNMCDAGYVCVSGADNAHPTDGIKGYICPAGYYCPAGSSQGTKCPQGTFSNNTGLHNVTGCQDCSPGKYCNVEGLTAPAGLCTAGHYCTLRAIVQSPIGQSYGDYCPVGYYCPQGTGTPTPCPAGTYLPDTGRSDVSYCIDCPGGMYCDRPGLANFTGMCAEGYYCYKNATTSTPTDGTTGDVCPVGHYCPAGISNPLPCADGTYMNVTQASSCIQCPARYYCVNANANPIPCPRGRYCPSGVGFDHLACPVGTYGPNEMLMLESECTQCDGGYYCESPGLSNVSGPCAAGYYCFRGVNTAAPSNNNTGTGGYCIEAQYCPEGTMDPKPCPEGTYNDQTHQGSCKTCPAGYYCLSGFNTYTTSPCPKGSYCPAGTQDSAQYKCPAGTYNNVTLADSDQDCLPCPGGHYCAGEGLSEPTGICAAGWYCSGGAYSELPDSNFSDTYSINSTCPIYSLNFTGGKCPPGNYCPAGSSAPFPCPLGKYCDESEKTSPKGDCSEGFFCNGSASVPDPVPCSKGHYCPQGTILEEPCPPGTFSNTTGNSAITGCLPCTAGYYCPSYGMVMPTELCSEGYYCPGGINTPMPTSYPCSPGYFCLNGSANQTSCPSGTFQPSFEKSSCDICPAGFYCQAVDGIGVSNPTECPVGSYCPEGTKFAAEYLCPAGYYSNITGLSNETQCTPCDPAYYCSGEGNTKPTGHCSPGYYCSLGAYNSTPTDGVTGNICPAGQYCLEGSITGMGCPLGTFSNKQGLQAIGDCTSCTPGYYCGSTGLTSESGSCWAGYYCSGRSEVPNPSNQTYGNECLAGHYCPNGTHTPQPCPAGTFQPMTGLKDVNDCSSCSPGYYCEFVGLTAVTGKCRAGYYCTMGANNSAPTDGTTGNICPQGHYCVEGSVTPTHCGNGTFINHTGASACYPCPAGYYCVNRDRADICKQGYYCPDGTGANLRPCPLGTFGNTTGLTQESECTPCTGGHFCGTPGSPSVDGQCQAGYYCESGVDTATPTSSTHTGVGDECPEGSYCPIGSARPIPCSPGTFTGVKGKGSCDICPAGYYCKENTIDPTIYPCPSGHYCPQRTKYDSQYPCPAGTYNPLTNQSSEAACSMCDPGRYCQGEGLSATSGNCSEGWFCTGGATHNMPILIGNYTAIDQCTCPEYNYTGGRCQPGSYCPEGSSSPVNCEAGWYCDDYELPTPKGQCDAGYYCPVGQTVANPSAFICTTGHYCLRGSATPTPCPTGTFSNSTGNIAESDCRNCTAGYYCESPGLTQETHICSAGYYCPEGQSSPAPLAYECPQGYYCPAGSSAPVMCPAGYFNLITGQSTCEKCPARFYCDPSENNNTGIVTPTDCPPGYYCPNQTEYAKQNPCPAGTYGPDTSMKSSTDCLQCEPGHYCQNPGRTDVGGSCSAGYVCLIGSATPTPTDNLTGYICPEGTYCEEGTLSPSNCPVGTYNNMTGLRAVNECIPCEPGYYCPSQGTVNLTQLCSAGYFCKSGSPEATPDGQSYGYKCPVGHYCPQGTPSPVPCPRGTYLSTEGGQSQSDCVPCTAGWYCLLPGSNLTTEQCMAGYYCIERAQTATPTDGVTGNICPIGHYCPAGSYSPIPCSNATYMNHTGASKCDDCPYGFTCTKGDRADPCPQGYYCPPSTGFNYIPCPIGTFGATVGLGDYTECSNCTGGMYCDITGLTEPAGGCEPGYYCVSSVSIATPNSGVSHTGTGDRCPAGSECPANSTYPNPCDPGTYAPTDTMPTCLPCPNGSYCLNETAVPVICPAAYYCPEGTEFATQYPCPAGTYNNHTGASKETDCMDCPPGYYCQGTGNMEPTGLCNAGFFCAGKSSEKRPLDIGNTTMSGLYPNDTCTPTWDCVCPNFQMTTGGMCPMGYYCPEGSARPTPCTPGMYCATPGLTVPTGNCTEGYYCTNTSSSPTQFDCPPGSYCPQGSSVPTLCPAGTYGTSSNYIAQSDCILCTAGKYCAGLGNTAPTGNCSPGYYCTLGQSSPTPSDLLCWAGYYCMEGSVYPIMCTNGTYQMNNGSDSCDECPPSYYCDPGYSVVMPAACPRGYYCPSGTASNYTYPCPSGTFGPDEYYFSVDNCTQCTAGFYCDAPGRSTPAAECFAGFYCTGGASSPTPVNHLVNSSVTNAFTGNDRCPTGYYCPNGTTYPKPCPLGTFSSIMEVTSVDGCEACPRGRYCHVSAFTNSSIAPPCSAGFVCTGGSFTSTPVNSSQGGYICPAGHFCVEGTLEEEGCTIGTFQSNEGKDSCITCPAGFMCLHMNMTQPEPCQTGYYCPFNYSTPVACPAGTYNNDTHKDHVLDCVDCPVGKYCEGTGNSKPDGDCDAGFFCQGGSDSRAPSNATTKYPNNGLCPVRNYCPSGTTYLVKCPAGTIRNNTGAKSSGDCYSCPGGKYCAYEGQIEATGNCSRGFYCPDGENNSSPNPAKFICPAGYYCPEGSAIPLSCEAGYYQTDEGQWECDPCTAGYYCENGSSPERKDCPAYHYCPAGTKTPILCPNGTYTQFNTTKLQSASDCLPCEAGVYCRAGQIQANCSAGYFCKSGAKGDMPTVTSNFSTCTTGDECAGPCPTGNYCPEGATLPIPCEDNTYRNLTGAAQKTDCAACPPGYICGPETTTPTPCKPGYYCEGGNGTIPCPKNTYRPTPGAAYVSDCIACPSGYICNSTGLTNYTLYACPVGYFCPAGQDPKLCPAGRMRDTPGAGNWTDCPLCRPGYYCPNDTVNTQGIPCKEKFKCPEGASEEIDCDSGYYCNGTTGVPPICPAGYYCPNATDIFIPCQYPYYCPLGSNMTLKCDLGYQALDHAGIRYSINASCRRCPPGTYGNATDRSKCETCPAGYYCPAGTGNGDTNPCPVGSYCPLGSDEPTLCSPGKYGKKMRAEGPGDCYDCPANYYQNLYGQTDCLPCGSSSYSVAGSGSCTCTGKYRNFQYSDGYCVCQRGYIYYDEVDLKRSEENGREDCQQIVDDRCSTDQARHASTRKCVNPKTYDCTAVCPDSSGSFNIDLGRCQCSSYIDPDSICNTSCRLQAPSIKGQLKTDGTFELTVTDSSGNTNKKVMENMIGPLNNYAGKEKKLFIATMYSDRITSSIFSSVSDTAAITESPQNLISSGGSSGRRRLLATSVPSNEVPNPVVCVEANDMFIFKVWMNTTDRASSHYPVYQKDHLFNTNPNFDYGAFTSLADLILNTNANISSFAYVFTDGGNYVFADAQDSNIEMLIRVMSSGSTCDSSVSQVQSQTVSSLYSMGFNKGSVSNQAPDWGLIIGLIAFCGALVLLLVVAVIVWKPHESGVYPMKHWKPQFRSLGSPPPVPTYMRYDSDHWPVKPHGGTMGQRMEGDGMDAESMTGDKVEKDLEEFNVRVLYDKLEDQNLHLASQLARQKEDLKEFYVKIAKQNEELKLLLQNMDPEKLALLEQKLEARAKAFEKLQTSGGGSGDVNIINTSLKLGGLGETKYKFTGGSGREGELMEALKQLLDKLNSGNIPINKKVWEQLKNGTTGGQLTLVDPTATIAGKGMNKTWAELLRQQNMERLRMERDLLREEQEALEAFLEEEEDKRKSTVGAMTDGLVSNLQGDLRDTEVKDIMNNYEKTLESNMSKLSSDKERQANALRQKLAERRKQREEALAEKHRKEANDVGLPPAPDKTDVSDVKLRTSQSVLDALQAEESAAAAKSETELDDELGEEERRVLSEKMNEHLDALTTQGVITPALRDKLLQQHHDAEMALAQVHNQRRQQQISNLKEKIAQRRRKRIEKLRNKHEKEKSDLSARLIQEGRHEDLEREMAALKRLLEQEMEAAEAEMDAEENEHVQKITENLNNEHTAGLKEKQRKILAEVVENCPAAEQVAMQRLMDQHRHELEALQQDLNLQRDRHVSDLQAKLAARRARRLAESQRKLEEEEAQRIVAEQRRQVQQGQDKSGQPVIGSDLAHIPKVNVAGDTVEEKALRKEQERAKENIRKQQHEEQDALVAKLDKEATKEEVELKKEMENEREKAIRELKNKQAAELASRQDLTQEQLSILMASHEQELEELSERFENEKTRQLQALRDKIAHLRGKKLDKLRRKQEVQLTKEMLEQKKEIDELKLKKAKEAEREAIREGIKDNGEDESEKVIKAVLAQRQAKETENLERQFNAEKKMMVDDALSKLHDKYDRLRDEMSKRHQDELEALQKEGLSPEEYQHRKAELLNRQQLELSNLERKLAAEEADVEKGALTDWELRFAKAKLALKERHYQEFADALREFTSNKTEAKSAEQQAKELEEVERQLEQKRKEEEARMKLEKEEFEKAEQKRIENEMKQYAKELEQETSREKEKHEKNLESLNQRKEELIRERRNKMKEELEKLRQQGASEEDQKLLLQQHERDLQNIVNKMEADKLRMQSNLQERLRKRKEEKLRSKQKELANEAKEHEREIEQKQRSVQERMKADEVLTINEALNIDSATSRPEYSTHSKVFESVQKAGPDDQETSPPTPSSYNMTVPLNEAELMALLMASPLYQKMEQIRRSVAKGDFRKSAAKDSIRNGGYHDTRDSEWEQDTELQPADLNKLNARTFIVYKFGCFVTELVAVHCQHPPVTILLADKIPANQHLGRNSYRNSFHYDANNHILYIRTARLDTVGEFVVVLVHTLAHIKSGDLRDDSEPDFLHEYHRALAVVCDDLFFARFRHSSNVTQSISASTGASVEQAALKLLQAMFGSCHTEDDKVQMVDDLLDMRLLPTTTVDGIQFNRDRILERLAKYSSFSMTNKLHTVLGSLEDKIKQAKAQGSSSHMDHNLWSLSQRYSTSGTTVLTRQPPISFTTANMTGHALWKTLINEGNKEHEDLPTADLPEDKKSPEDRYDDLCADFTQVNKSILTLRDRIQEMEEEEFRKSKGNSNTNDNITQLKLELTKLEKQKKQILDRMEETQI